MPKKKQRRTWSASEKLRIVLAGMEPSVEVSDLCRREGVSPAQFYQWKKQLLGSAEAVFGDKRTSKAQQRAEQQHEQEIRRKDAVIAEITAENLELKKTL